MGEKKSYGELLRDPRWQRRRLEILTRSDFSCELCLDKESTLNVHHKLYRKGAAPWEYEDRELIVLCNKCHEETHRLRERLNGALADIHGSDLLRIVGYVEALRVWMSDVPRSMRLEDYEHARGASDVVGAHEDTEQLIDMRDADNCVSTKTFEELYRIRRERKES